MPSTGGVAFSGGGVIAMLASACQLRALEQLVPNVTSHEISATSGGIVGVVLMRSTASRLGFPPAWSPSDYSGNVSSQLSQRFRTGGTPWFAAVTDVLEPLLAEQRRSSVNSSWWSDILVVVARLYRLQPDELRGYDRMTMTVSMLRKAAAPLDRDAAGVLQNATGNLIPSVWHPADGVLRPIGTGAASAPSPQPMPLVTAMAAGTAFWAASLLESRILYDLLGGLLPSLPPPNDQFLLLDGGTIDSTAIVALLRRNVSRAVAFYDNSFALRDVSSQLGFLFGVANATSNLAMWEGPRLAQLFAPELWPAVFANLTARGVAHLDGVDVRPNEYLGVAGGYRMESLLIIAAQGSSESFLREMDAVDPSVRALLHPGWPETMPLAGMTPLDANALCVYSGWGVMQARDEIQRLFRVDHGADGTPARPGSSQLAAPHA